MKPGIPEKMARAPREPEPKGFVTTAVLLARAREGDSRARDEIAGRYRTALCRWAHGRLPARARDLVDTDDVVQSTLVRGLKHLDTFEPRREGAFMAYLRQILLNKIHDESRRGRRRPEHVDLDDSMSSGEPSALERTIGLDNMNRYETALATLPDGQREAVILRLEMGYRYREVAEATGSPTANAARMMVARAMLRLAEQMREGGHE